MKSDRTAMPPEQPDLCDMRSALLATGWELQRLSNEMFSLATTELEKFHDPKGCRRCCPWLFQDEE